MAATEKQALIVVDMLNPYEHEDADQLSASVEDTDPDLAQAALTMMQRNMAAEIRPAEEIW